MRQTSTGPMLIAHRGGSLEAPENTLASFRHAISVGARYVELDVQMSEDGVLVVIHDDTVDRTTNGTGPVRDYTYTELKKLDAGSHFAPEYSGETIPTLREVLELCAGAGVGVVIEIKSPHLYPGMVEKTVALLAEMKAQGARDYWCISFDHASIRQVRALDPDVPLGYLYEPTEQMFVYPDDTVQAYCPYYRTALAHPEQVQQARDMGKNVLVYTVDDPEDVRRLAEIGVAGMVTDRPGVLLRANILS
ncbi:MAG TPA: glycerophosphodiester phosphodiesterase family protein [Chloroflexia bacterium]|nr:glycerophosphodiester phosphodiesterase family protein [Chloroflexia bacterium]